MIRSVNISARQWAELGLQKTDPGTEGAVMDYGPLWRHSQRFLRGRKARIAQVSGMTLDKQCEYYRKLGFFKEKS